MHFQCFSRRYWCTPVFSVAYVIDILYISWLSFLDLSRTLLFRRLWRPLTWVVYTDCRTNRDHFLFFSFSGDMVGKLWRLLVRYNCSVPAPPDYYWASVRGIHRQTVDHMQRTSNGLHDPWKSCRLNSRVVHDFRYRHINVTLLYNGAWAGHICFCEHFCGVFVCIWGHFYMHLGGGVFVGILWLFCVHFSQFCDLMGIQILHNIRLWHHVAYIFAARMAEYISAFRYILNK